MTSNMAPDLESGFLVFEAPSGNSWSTEILCAAMEEADQPRAFYLSKECRSEDIAFHGGSAEGRIFQSERSWEFLMGIFDGRPMQMTNGDVAILPVDQNGDRPVFDFLIKPTAMGEDFSAEVNCPLREISTLPFTEVLEGLRGRDLSVRDLFMKIAYAHEGRACEIYCPCRYINFGTRGDDANDYVQPISGYVVTPPMNGEAQIGYIACTVAADGTNVIEFCGKRYRNIFDWLAGSFAAELGGPEMARNLSKTLPIFATMFDRIARIEGTCEFFTYGPAER